MLYGQALQPSPPPIAQALIHPVPIEVAAPAAR